MNIGVFGIQGDVYENIQYTRIAMNDLGINGKVNSITTSQEINEIDGLIIPGGESTTIGQLAFENNSLDVIKKRIQEGMPVLGICAGMILLSKSASDYIVGETKQPLLEALDITIERNSFGHQNNSFETSISMDSIGISKFKGVFIRAPSISNAQDIQISKLGDKIIAVKKDHIIGTAFHPELSGDISLHKYFVSKI